MSDTPVLVACLYRTEQKTTELLSEWCSVIQEKGWAPALPSGTYVRAFSDVELGDDVVAKMDLAYLARCECLILGPEWRTSERCRLAHSFAERNGLPYFEPDSPDHLRQLLPRASDFCQNFEKVFLIRESVDNEDNLRSFDGVSLEAETPDDVDVGGGLL